jgi:hypothetical protein
MTEFDNKKVEKVEEDSDDEAPVEATKAPEAVSERKNDLTFVIILV